MPASSVRGVLPAREMERLDVLTPALLQYFGPFTCGFATLRGTEFPVVDLRARLGLPHASHGRQACIVVVEAAAGAGPRLVGFIADRVSAVVRVRERDFSGPKLRLSGRLRDVLIPDVLLNFEPVLDRG